MNGRNGYVNSLKNIKAETAHMVTKAETAVLAVKTEIKAAF